LYRFSQEWDLNNADLLFVLEQNLYHLKQQIFGPGIIVMEINESDDEYEEGDEWKE